MRAAVLGGFPSFTTAFEGRLRYMYTDGEGLVTTGVGNLIDPMAAALPLPWENPDGSPATTDRVAQVWTDVKQAFPGLQSVASVNVPGNDLRLSDDAVDALVQSKLRANEELTRSYFPGWDDLPADAQMGILSMDWAMGAGFPASWPHFAAAVNAQDFDLAATQSQMRPTPGIGPRNAANMQLFRNAAIVQRSGGNPETLWYPAVAQPGQTGGAGSTGGGGSIAGAILGGVAVLALSAAGWWFFRGRV